MNTTEPSSAEENMVSKSDLREWANKIFDLHSAMCSKIGVSVGGLSRELYIAQCTAGVLYDAIRLLEERVNEVLKVKY